ncbi:HNH endonuclease [Rhodococcus sp. IEGM 248]|nr:HNH endonuclease [Rhodococcus sp. IEGM 248]
MTKPKEIRPGGNEADQVVNGTSGFESTVVRICRQCRDAKPLTAFAVDRSQPDGRRSLCAACRAAYDRQRASETRYRQRCRSYGFEPVVEPFTREQQIDRYGDRCAYCKTGAFETSDHILCVAAGGHHTLENVVPCCASCNRQKCSVIDWHLIRIFRAACADSEAVAS